MQNSRKDCQLEQGLEHATFGAGCFWGTEAAFRRLSGVRDTSVGYMGGHWDNPSYLDVAARVTGHAEVAQVCFNPAEISYSQLLELFWTIHDPTSLNRQGADRGEQYRSAIFTHNPQQEAIAQASKKAAAERYDIPIVTEIKPASVYYLATEDHQQYFEKRGRTATRE
ncbi:MAG: peptide-methionine (S)-S-oxide reductase MsrA [Cyanobacteria bacterium J06555_12]